MRNDTSNPFNALTFVTSANDPVGFPPGTAREVAFAGRSNAGKSSAINAIAGRRGLAHVSRTPGRTRLINFFAFDADDRSSRRIVDLPGYGFAAVNKSTRTHWEDFLASYIALRENLVGVVVVSDARHALVDADRNMLHFLATHHRPVLMLLTKSDKLSRSEAARVLKRVRAELDPHRHVRAELFSATSGVGVETARAAIGAWLE